jgi:hypothetical protein
MWTSDGRYQLPPIRATPPPEPVAPLIDPLPLILAAVLIFLDGLIARTLVELLGSVARPRRKLAVR